MRVAVLGAGQMGTAFGVPLLERGYEVRFWGPDWIDASRLEAIAAGDRHPDLDAPLSDAPVETTTNLEEAVEDADICVLAVTSEGAGWVAERAARAAPRTATVVVLTKGFVERDGEVVPVTTLVGETFGDGRALVGVGGPVKAAELIRRVPTRTVFASELLGSAQKIAAAVGTGYYFPTTTDDLVGTEACAALKNCYAIAVNLIAGGAMGKANLRALAFSAALEEMYTLVVAAGGRPETVVGAAGSGDLYVTCLSGRNGDFGRLLAEGHGPEEALALMNGATVEGLEALPSALKLAHTLNLEEELPMLRYLDDTLRAGGTKKDHYLARLMSG